MRETRAVTEFDGWDERTSKLLRDAYLAGGAGPPGSGSGDASEGEWRGKRQHPALPIDASGSWLDIRCAQGPPPPAPPGWGPERPAGGGTPRGGPDPPPPPLAPAVSP